MADKIELIPTNKTLKCSSIETLAELLPEDQIAGIIKEGLTRYRRLHKPRLVEAHNTDQGPYSA